MLDENLRMFHNSVLRSIKKQRISFIRIEGVDDIKGTTGSSIIIDIDSISYIQPYYIDGKELTCIGINGKEIIVNCDYTRFSRDCFHSTN